MRAFLLLADAAQVQSGKLYILGGGWSWIMAGAPFAVAMKLDVPWSEATSQHSLRLELVDTDGEPFEVPTVEGGTEPLVVEMPSFTTGIPPGVKQGTPIDYAAAWNFIGLPLAANVRYEWRLSIDGNTNPDWCLAFSTVAAPPMQAVA